MATATIDPHYREGYIAGWTLGFYGRPAPEVTPKGPGPDAWRRGFEAGHYDQRQGLGLPEALDMMGAPRDGTYPPTAP